ncbi:MAG: epoxyqueuosine reductase QueH [Firmicutes bacterium]|nr:epoxyqueuosine reductase QueH [Bacillota bacterium]
MRNLLVHTCCGPCFAYPYSVLKDEFNITSYFYNPNIHPSMEYIRRLEALAEFCRLNKVELKVGEYDPKIYFKEIAGREGDRCRICYSIRLNEAARFAAENGYSAFTTTLLVSPYQKHDAIKDAGEEAGNKYRIEFKYWDFRHGFRAGQERAKELNLYRQPYCGCVFSEFERYSKKLEKSVKKVRDGKYELGAIG